MANETDYNLFQKYNFISEQYTKYFGSSLYIMCLCGSLMNILTFLQRTYNRRACSLYLLISSICDFIHLNIGLLTTVLQYGFHYNFTINSITYYRIKNYLVYVFIIISATLTTLAGIDRYMLSSEKSTRWNYSRRSVGIRNIKSTIFFWAVISIPIIFCSEHSYHSFEINQITCSNSRQPVLCILVRIIYICLLNGFIPPLIMMIFGLLTYNNARHLYQRSQLKSIRVRQINQQLTSMLILQSIKSTITSIPYSIFNFYRIRTVNKSKTLGHQAIDNLINQIVELLFWSNYTSFYIYIYSSDIFKNQWIKTMKKIIFCTCRKHTGTALAIE